MDKAPPHTSPHLCTHISDGYLTVHLTATDISKEESVPLQEIPNYIKEKLEGEKKIEGEIKEADTLLHSKNVSTETINEHLQLNEELDKHGLSTDFGYKFYSFCYIDLFLCG